MTENNTDRASEPDEPTTPADPFADTMATDAVGSASAAASGPAAAWGTTAGAAHAATGTIPRAGHGASAYRPTAGYPAAFADERRGPCFGTIFWGVVLLVFAAFMAVWTLQPRNLDPTLWLLGSVIVLGLLLVVAGIAAAFRRPD